MSIAQKGETLILASSDPAIEPVKGYRRLLVGLDVAQAKDRNAFSILLDELVPSYGPMKRRREVVRAEFLPAMTYTGLAQVVRNLMNDPALAGCAHLAVDATGVGRAFCDVLSAEGLAHRRVQMTTGESESTVKERDAVFDNVGKVRLLSTLSSAFHMGDLQIGAFSERETLRNELESFESKVTTAGRTVIEGGTAFSHADLAISTALANWLSDHPSVTATIGEHKLRGFY